MIVSEKSSEEGISEVSGGRKVDGSSDAGEEGTQADACATEVASVRREVGAAASVMVAEGWRRKAAPTVSAEGWVGGSEEGGRFWCRGRTAGPSPTFATDGRPGSG